jgi:hypothetical protein
MYSSSTVRSFSGRAAAAVLLFVASGVQAQLSETSITWDPTRPAVVTVPQIDFLHEHGITWGAVRKAMIENRRQGEMG